VSLAWKEGYCDYHVCSASGSFLLPIFTYPSWRITSCLENGDSLDAVYSCWTSECSNEELFSFVTTFCV